MMRRRLLAVLLVAGTPAVMRAQAPGYLDPDQPLAERVTDLVGRMTLDEKISQMMDVAPAIERLGVPEYNWWNEALHGVARSGLATVFPQAIGLAATWDESLMHRVATVISDEARAKHHEYLRNGKRLRYQGLTIWSPNINLFRDPRWGRGQETYGEDPFLTGRMAVQFVRGLQGDDPNYLKTVSTVKHYAVHSGPEPDRHTFDAVVSERDLRETYLPAFRAGIMEGGAYSLMCAYNRVYGQAACASDLLLQSILRGEWGFRGYVVSDCGAIDDIWQRHKVVSTGAAAAALAVKSGTDLECGDDYRRLSDAVKQGLVTEAAIDTAVTRLFTARFRLGMFDPESRVKYAQIPYRNLDSPAHRELARRAARESIVLLKNDGALLPLRKTLRTIAVIGPNADEPYVLFGNYNGTPADPITPLRGIREAVPHTKVTYARGAELADSFPSYMNIPARDLFDENGQPGLKTEYFANADMTGPAVQTLKDSAIDVNWRAQAPRADLDPDNFAVRWTGVLRPDETGTYRLGLNGNMRYELYLDDSLAVRSTYGYRNEFGDPRLRTGKPVRLEQGRSYRIRVEAHETYGDAELHLVMTRLPRNLLTDALAAARNADAVVLVLGLTPRLEGEEMDVRIDGFSGGDRTSLDLPATQEKLLEQVVAIGKPTVLVLLNGSALAVNWAEAHVPAILEAWYPGQAGGTAIADVLFGDYDPAGRLPVTFYRSVNDLPAFADYSMHGRTYRYFDGQPLYPFGHGLSYTTFRYDSASARVRNDTIYVATAVTNTGTRAGDEVVQLYVQHVNSKVARPKQELRGFQRISLKPGEKQSVTFAVPKAQLAYWDSTTHDWANEPGQIRLRLGASSADIRRTVVIDLGSTRTADHATPRYDDLWLRYSRVADATRLQQYRAALNRVLVTGTSPTMTAARRELQRGLSGLLATAVPAGRTLGNGTVLAGTPANSRAIAQLPFASEFKALGREGYLVRATKINGQSTVVIAANSDVGVLYGVFGFLRHLQTERSLASLALKSVPKFELRMLDHWDNVDGSVERGYAGKSLWQWRQLPDTLDPRYVDYARANASIGINAAAITNVNSNPIFLTHDYLVKAASLANVFRPYGIKLFLTARFSSPVEMGALKTADPLDPAVQSWWRQKADEIYALIPDFGGFLMKANSEGQPGPKDYNRSHAEGANLIADAVAPHGGIVIWRAFVYANGAAIDRAKQAYDEFTPLDGQFRPNVFIQVKNGPVDFQPREPFSPLFGAMPKTPLMAELQITKEYLGQYSSLVYLAPMWTEVLHADTYTHGPGSTVAKMLDGTLTKYPHTGIAGVANTGDDANWSGSAFNQANWYAFGRLAWNPDLSAAGIADEWIRMTFSNRASVVQRVTAMLLNSREAAVNYMTPLGLAHQMNGRGHYGPGPWQGGGPRADWTPPYYARADSLGIGFDRTPAGSNAVAQYHAPLDRKFADRATVGDTLLLWFHHVGWNEQLPSGRTLWQELVRHYNMGVDTVKANLQSWNALEGQIDPERFRETQLNLEKEIAEARWWRDASLLYWQTFNQLPIPAEYEQPAHPLQFYQSLRCPIDLIHSYCPEITGVPPHATKER